MFYRRKQMERERLQKRCNSQSVKVEVEAATDTASITCTVHTAPREGERMHTECTVSLHTAWQREKGKRKNERMRCTCPYRRCRLFTRRFNWKRRREAKTTASCYNLFYWKDSVCLTNMKRKEWKRWAWIEERVVEEEAKKEYNDQVEEGHCERARENVKDGPPAGVRTKVKVKGECEWNNETVKCKWWHVRLCVWVRRGGEKTDEKMSHSLTIFQMKGCKMMWTQAVKEEETMRRKKGGVEGSFLSSSVIEWGEVIFVSMGSNLYCNELHSLSLSLQIDLSLVFRRFKSTPRFGRKQRRREQRRYKCFRNCSLIQHVCHVHEGEGESKKSEKLKSLAPEDVLCKTKCVCAKVHSVAAVSCIKLFDLILMHL